jgi:hypothetical protein
MAGRLRELAGVGGDRHRQRRLLVQDLADAAGRIGGGDAVLVVLEDLHWADQLSLEVVAHLAAGWPAGRCWSPAPTGATSCTRACR